MDPTILPAGDRCVFVDFGDSIDLETNGRVQALARRLKARPFHGMTELVPTYRSLSIYFDPLTVDLPALKNRLARDMVLPVEAEKTVSSEIALPVCYGGSYGPDMVHVTAHTGLTEDEVITRHTGTALYCYMLGFVPGFCYLGGMDPSLATPRLQTPRETILPGSVGIAGSQTGAYSVASPGGWQLIGRTPVRLYDPHREPAAAMEAGMWVRFYPVTPEKFRELESQVSAGQYRLEITERGAGR